MWSELWVLYSTESSRISQIICTSQALVLIKEVLWEKSTLCSAKNTKRKKEKNTHNSEEKESKVIGNWKLLFVSAREKLKHDKARTVNGDGEHSETATIMKRKPLEGESNESLNFASVINKQITKFVTPPCDLLHWQDMPQHLQFNPYVRKGKLTVDSRLKFKLMRLLIFYSLGYRPLQDIKGCINSLFYLHNETINILTHGESIQHFRMQLTLTFLILDNSQHEFIFRFFNENYSPFFSLVP